MDDYKIIIYILAAAAYFLITQWRKAFKSDTDTDERPPREQQTYREQPPRPVTSFEDILREMQPKAKRATQEARERVQEAVTQTIPTVAATTTQSKYKSYEGPAPKVLSWEKPAEALEAAKRSRLHREKSFDAYERKRRVSSKYAEILKNPTTARDAVILSEIFNRKYK
ncbi:hypothetical protein [Pontibacter oryzae]|uniref:Uncharacterized protein n=1 Tax=Pontibacter oryzae TaxID=2304593 RepID=A0A399SHM0_9BACT|nr:hypothetical protein [Pontibacter oryzae]RIJ41582.1 hypothetical protein D1627_06000 [Pontibacter oryzae]